jgi:predicted transcriptional regulator
MPVDTICNHNVATIEADEDIIEAAKRMRQTHVGDLIVVENRDGRDVPIGVITDRDIVIQVVAKDVAPSTLKVADAMSRELITVRKDNGIDFALQKMQRAGVRRIPVVDRNGALSGVLAMDDVVDHLAAQLGYIAGAIRIEQRKETQTRP